ncbi:MULTISPECIES: alkaline phosphatase D family protein [Leptospira]|uniref:PhoD-like phosphatase n=4 Tax=Leptospira borgpetersenii TaxID=174 RepID=M3GI57_LEPBO|nr:MULTISPECIES: alkaline phosphatase D family protein [Leptospira]EMG00657.1 PhoD-like phosphatase [Leptospira borgpetersenii str. 200701203]EMO12075.1 PhoD-like phosphatase [Leptospira borgpetersenii str. Noumea 25]AXX16980.1 phosphodiesterase [Leptospira borgpetersenii serovar Ceylonica]EKP12482.1 PhoD-like phosphatase [Leptospira borgpetersenii str. 200801926]EKQ93407.1 PhoD-like phosphatase [Leptospira borgpetersenii str. UI 09149]
MKFRILKHKRVLYYLLLIFNLQLNAEAAKIVSGPILGYSTLKEVLVWIQTDQASKVALEYSEIGNPRNRYISETIQTDYKTGFIAKLIANRVEPGKSYNYNLLVDGKRIKGEHPQTFQAQSFFAYASHQDPPSFSFALGSCAYVNESEFDVPGKPYGGEYFIFNSILSKKPNFMLWLGDNIYLREPDWDSRTGFLHRYRHQRGIPELAPLFASVHHYAIWDDHDFGPNDSDSSFWMRETSEEMFKLHWGNPNYAKEGIYGSFVWGDVQFFLLDNRTFRTANNNREIGPRQILGEKQFQWFVNSLAYSKATFKFVAIGGQFLNPNPVFENHATYPQERNKILSAIRDLKIKNLIFLTGDRHHTELNFLQEDDISIYDFTVSPLTSRYYSPSEKNPLRVEGTLVDKRNFGTISVSGKRGQRKLVLQIFDVYGKELWKKEILPTP